MCRFIVVKIYALKSSLFIIVKKQRLHNLLKKLTVNRFKLTKPLNFLLKSSVALCYFITSRQATIVQKHQLSNELKRLSDACLGC